MSLSVPPVLKKISPFIKRAEELDKDKTAAESRLVAFYCRQYAVHLGIGLAGDSLEAKTCLGEILGDLEKEKAAMSNFTTDEAAFLCRKFAYAVFEKADAADRAGNGGKGTAKAFYAAVSFLEILGQFSNGEDDEQAQEDKKKIVYSKWKATDILKAIKEGRTPTPGGYGEEEMNEKEEADEDEFPLAGGTPVPFVPPPAPSPPSPRLPPPVETVTNDYDDAPVSPMTTIAPMPPTQPPMPPMQPPPPEPEPFDFPEEGTEVELGPPPSYPVEADALSFQPTPKNATPRSGGSIFGFGGKKSKASKAQIQDATELTQFALTALEEKDPDAAATHLKKALAALGR